MIREDGLIYSEINTFASTYKIIPGGSNIAVVKVDNWPSMSGTGQWSLTNSTASRHVATYLAVPRESMNVERSQAPPTTLYPSIISREPISGRVFSILSAYTAHYPGSSQDTMLVSFWILHNQKENRLKIASIQ